MGAGSDTPIASLGYAHDVGTARSTMQEKSTSIDSDRNSLQYAIEVGLKKHNIGAQKNDDIELYQLFPVL